MLLCSLVFISPLVQGEQLKAYYLGSPLKLVAQDNVQLQFRLELEPGYKAYLDQFKFIIESPVGFKSGEVKISPTHKFFDKFSKSERLGFEKTGTLSVIIEASESYSGEKILGSIIYQACTDTYCLFPQTVNVEIPVDDEAKVSDNSIWSSIKNFSPNSDSLTELLQQNLFLTFLLVFIMGILTSFTPCVYPLIPITVSVLGRQNAGKKWKATVLYVFGICLTYSALGVVAALSGALFGSFINHPYVISIVVGVLAFMALSEFGIIEFKTPLAIEQKLSQYTHSGVFVAGLVAGLIASPCVGPMLVGILTYVAQTQNAVLGFALLFVYAFGMGQLLLLLGTSTAALKLLPKSGPWMEAIKDLFGFVLLIMAYYYLRPLLSQPAGDIGFAVTLIAISFWRGAWKVFVATDKSEILHKAFLLVIVSGSILWGYQQSQAPQILKVSGEKSVESHSLSKPAPWLTFTDQDFQAALKSGKPVLVDFWAEWCAACFELEEKTFSDPRVKEVFSKWELLHFDATKDSPELQRLKKEYNIVGLPTVLLFDSKGTWRKDKTLTQFEDADKFLLRVEPLTR